MSVTLVNYLLVPHSPYSQSHQQVVAFDDEHDDVLRVPSVGRDARLRTPGVRHGRPSPTSLPAGSRLWPRFMCAGGHGRNGENSGVADSLRKLYTLDVHIASLLGAYTVAQTGQLLLQAAVHAYREYRLMSAPCGLAVRVRS